MSGQSNYFSANLESEEELQRRQLNVMTTLTQAGECLPLLEVNRIEYQAQNGVNAQDTKRGPTEFKTPPLTSGIKKVKRIRVTDIKPVNNCKYCKKASCTCLDKCYSHCNSHFTYCVCYDSCQECNK